MGGQAELLTHAPLVMHRLRLQAVVFGDVAVEQRGKQSKSQNLGQTEGPFPLSHAWSQRQQVQKRKGEKIFP